MKGSERIFCKYLYDQGIKYPKPEYIFHPTRQWRFDMAWPEIKLAIEIEGGIYGRGKPCPTCKQRRKGAHGSVTGLLRDIEKYNQATYHGWKILRCTPDQLNSLEFINLVIDTINQHYD